MTATDILGDNRFDDVADTVTFCLYKDVHKGIRSELFSITELAGRSDSGDLVSCLAVSDRELDPVDICSRHIAHLHGTEQRLDVILDVGAVRGHAARLLVGQCIFGNEAVGEVRDGLGLPPRLALPTHVRAKRNLGKPTLGDLPRLLDGKRTVLPDRGPTLLT